MYKKILSFIASFIKSNKKLCIALAVALGMALLIFWILFSNGYSGLHIHTRANDGQIKVACVGDSVTYGHGIKSWAKNNYPAQLQKILGDTYHVQNFGHSGKTVSDNGDQPYTESKQYKKSLEYDADVLVIMLGTNDSKPENWTNVETFINEYDELVESYKKNNPDIEIILCTPPCAFYQDEKMSKTTNFDIQPDIVQTIKNRIKVYALARGYKLVDIFDITQYHYEWFDDNVHPSKEGASAIAEAVAKKIKIE